MNNQDQLERYEFFQRETLFRGRQRAGLLRCVWMGDAGRMRTGRVRQGLADSIAELSRKA